ncbi:CRISPR-associated endonuclease Cas1 [uncultured Phascolarctobacterium sp.]|uniref:CRISPR-associated endonuclease Cas1 n=1 Tax=uncultured Phascolarctobacterium sp. TaxID=512296 RepID=UPI0027D96109|nr:CRISPR-associated endonuclease Cas1 [uncultured Phascolarctobacterium sp.]
MRKLLNTLYITNEQLYLTMNGENLVCKQDGSIIFRIPFDNIENIVCFNYLGCSPAVMGKCVSKCIPINFMSPQGRFLAKVCGETKGSVHLRVQQIDKFRVNGLLLAQNTIAAKLYNTAKLIQRSLHDNPQLRSDAELQRLLDILEKSTDNLYAAQDMDSILGIEGNCAKEYFAIFHKLLVNPKNQFQFINRSKRPPLNPVNAVLSFLYSIYTAEFGSALETVGIDSYIGYCHALRSGRQSLACDLVEETRCIVERFVLSMFNLLMVKETDFEKQISGAVLLTAESRKKIISRWQEKKRSDFLHPYLKQKIPFGLLPYVQANLLAKYLRGELDEYPCFIYKG